MLANVSTSWYASRSVNDQTVSQTHHDFVPLVRLLNAIYHVRGKIGSERNRKGEVRRRVEVEEKRDNERERTRRGRGEWWEKALGYQSEMFTQNSSRDGHRIEDCIGNNDEGAAWQQMRMSVPTQRLGCTCTSFRLRTWRRASPVEVAQADLRIKIDEKKGEKVCERERERERERDRELRYVDNRKTRDSEWNCDREDDSLYDTESILARDRAVLYRHM